MTQINQPLDGRKFNKSTSNYEQFLLKNKSRCKLGHHFCCQNLLNLNVLKHSNDCAENSKKYDFNS